jgi:hypothetical protein
MGVIKATMLPRIGEKFDGMGSFYKWTASAA